MRKKTIRIDINQDGLTESPPPPPPLCPVCRQPFTIIDQVDMHHYYDEEFSLWVTRWFTQDIEFCFTCEIVGRQLNQDEFETPRFPEQIDLVTWRNRQRKGAT